MATDAARTAIRRKAVTPGKRAEAIARRPSAWRRAASASTRPPSTDRRTPERPDVGRFSLATTGPSRAETGTYRAGAKPCLTVILAPGRPRKKVSRRVECRVSALKPGGSAEVSDRDELIDRLDTVIARLAYKASGKGRIRDEEKERIRNSYLRTLIQAANAERRLLKDRDLDDLAERVNALENGDSGSDFQLK